MDAVRADWKSALVSDRVMAGLKIQEIMTLRPLEIDQAFVEELRAELDDFAIREAANIAFHYNYINRVVDAFDYPIPRGKQTRRLAKLLNIVGKLVKGVTADPPWLVSEDDGIIRPTEVENGRNRMLSTDGQSDLDLRRAVEAFVKKQWRYEQAPDLNLPENLRSYMTKLALHAYRITQDDIDALKAAGYTEREIYELTIVGCLGTALVGLEMLFDAMYRGAETVGRAAA